MRGKLVIPLSSGKWIDYRWWLIISLITLLITFGVLQCNVTFWSRLFFGWLFPALQSSLPVGGVAVGHLLAGGLTLQTISVGHRLRRLVVALGCLGGGRCSAHGIEGIRLAVHRTDGEVLPVGAGHLLGRMDGERHFATGSAGLVSQSGDWSLVPGPWSLVSVSVAQPLSVSLSGFVSLSATAAALLEVSMRTVRIARSNAATSTTKTKNTKKKQGTKKGHRWCSRLEDALEVIFETKNSYNVLRNLTYK